MASNNETVADAVNAVDELITTLHAKEREEGCDIKDVWSLVQQVKNRIKAAHKREMENRALIAGVSLAEGYEATHKQEVGKLKKRLVAIVEYARKNRWSSHTIHHRLHNICMKNIIDLAKGTNK